MAVVPPPDSPPPRVRFWTTHPWTGKPIRVSRSPSPDYERMVERWANSTKREAMTGLVRPVAKGHPLPRTAPIDPNSTWALFSGSLFGLQQGAIPNVVDLHSPRVGRAFNWQPEGSLQATPLVIFPADPENPLCPPYPGLPPTNFDNPMNPVACFSDGGLGKWDPRYYPQVYNPRQPWLAFHQAPKPVSWWHGHVDLPTKGWASYNPHAKNLYRSPEPYYLPVTEFFDWRRPGRPDLGGCWKFTLLAQLFVARTSKERTVLAKVDDLREVLPEFDFGRFDLPWYDDLSFEDARKWTTWQEGRDALGRMCRYIAELEAFSCWLWATRSIGKGHFSRDPPCHTSFGQFMGTWAVTISSQSEWMDLYKGFVPIYVISELPASHSLVTQDLRFGELDGGERYRDNRFDAQHLMPNSIVTLPTIPPSPRPSSITFPRQNPIPSEIKSPLSPQDHDCLPNILRIVQIDPSPPLAHNKPWTSYLFTHSLAEGRVRLQDVSGSQNRWALAFKEQCFDLFYYVPPLDDILRVDTDPHPFFWICTESIERTDTHYEERFDKAGNYWWFRLARDKRLRKARRLPYAFSYPQHNITIHSAFPFPGRSPYLGRVDRCEPLKQVGPDLVPRRYFRQPPDSITEDMQPDPDYEWLPPEDISMENLTSEVMVPQGVQVETFGTFEDQFTQLEDALDQAIQNNPVPMDESSLLDAQITRFNMQRVELQMRVSRRLFKPIKGIHLQANSVTPWQLSKSANIYVWPLRFAGLHGDASQEILLRTLSRQYQVRLEDIIVIIAYQELDCSQTIDIGLRYAEDALWLWCLLHGTVADDRHIEVYPLKGLYGIGKALELPTASYRPGRDRAQRLRALLTLQELWPKNGDFPSDDMGHAATILSSRGNSGMVLNEYCPGEQLLPEFIPLMTFAVFPQLPSLRHVGEVPAMRWSREIYLLDGKERTQAVSLSAACEGNFNLFDLCLSKEAVSSTSTSRREVTFRRPTQSQLHRSSSKPYDPPPSRQLEEGEISDSGPSKQMRRRGKRAKLQRTATDKADPGMAQDMNCKARRSLASAVISSGNTLQAGSIIPLDPFIPLPNLPLVKLLSQWWDWLDQSRHHLDSKHDDPQYTEYDFTILQLVFTNQARLRNVYGKERRACQAALEKREPWLSRRQINEASLYMATREIQEGKLLPYLYTVTDTCTAAHIAELEVPEDDEIDTEEGPKVLCIIQNYTPKLTPSTRKIHCPWGHSVQYSWTYII
jgi:hypothetical protein